MDVRRLTHFIALAEEGRFAAAAERVHLSQAAFSRSIQTLEDRLGVRLVDRRTEGVSLTSTGATVLARARTLVFDSDCLVRDVALLKSGDEGELSIGMAPVAAAILLPELLVRLKRDRPRVVVRLHFGNVAQLMPLLEAQQIDLCFGDPRIIPATDRLERKSVAHAFGALGCRKGHPVARKASVVDAALMRKYGVGTISMPPELLAPIARSFGFTSAASFPMTLQCDDVKLLVQIALSTDLLVILPELPGAHAPGLHVLPWAQSRQQAADVNALWLSGRTLSPAAAFAIESARAIGKP